MRVRGELSRVKIHSSGHLYSDLKDADAVLNIVCWRGQVINFLCPEEGLDVVCTGKSRLTLLGRITRWFETMELAGEALCFKMLEEKKSVLLPRVYLMKAGRKCRPFCLGDWGCDFPDRTVIRDILHRLEDRFLATFWCGLFAFKGWFCPRDRSGYSRVLIC